MEIDEIIREYKILKEEYDKLIIAVKLKEKQEKLKQLEEETIDPNFYGNTDNSSKVLSKIKVLTSDILKYTKLEAKLTDLITYIELLEEENDNTIIKEAKEIINFVKERLEKLEITALLSGEYDSNNAIVTIYPGAGGTESQDWAEMLYRMYTKWANSSEYEIEVLDMEIGDEAGIKSVTILVKGSNAYGYLKAEKGVHRLVRISPFDSNSRRHTSFAAVEVMPEIDDDINIDIKSEDLEIGTYRASGAGGQHVNKTDSAIRIKHIPTNIVVTCQTERSQLQNKENAMKMLRSKLYEYEQKLRDKKQSDIKGDALDNSFGNQIRSYVFCPYTLVKDHRTGYEKGNVNAVMDGSIDEFMYEYLKKTASHDII